MRVAFVEMLKKEQGQLKDATFARTLGIDKATIYTWYSGKRIPTARTARKVCRALGFTALYTGKLINELEENRASLRNADPLKQERMRIEAEKNLEEATRIAHELSIEFVEVGRQRGMTQAELATLVGEFSSASLSKYVNGKQLPSTTAQIHMRRYIKNKTWDNLFVEVPKEAPKDASLLVEQVLRIGQSLGMTRIMLAIQLGGISPSSFVRWKKGEMPSTQTISELIGFVEDFNSSLPATKQIDPYALMPKFTVPIRIRIENYVKLHKLEMEYGGNLVECPADHPMLQEIRDDWGILILNQEEEI